MSKSIRDFFIQKRNRDGGSSKPGPSSADELISTKKQKVTHKSNESFSSSSDNAEAEL